MLALPMWTMLMGVAVKNKPMILATFSDRLPLLCVSILQEWQILHRRCGSLHHFNRPVRPEPKWAMSEWLNATALTNKAINAACLMSEKVILRCFTSLVRRGNHCNCRVSSPPRSFKALWVCTLKLDHLTVKQKPWSAAPPAFERKQQKKLKTYFTTLC